MAHTTGGTALAERPTDAMWLSMLPALSAAAPSAALPAVRAAAYLYGIARPAEGSVSGLRGAVTDLGVSHDGRHLVAAHYGDDAITVIDVATLGVVATASDIAEPYAVAIADRAYVRSASISDDTVVAVDLESGAQLATCEIGTGATGLVVSPAGDRLYVSRASDAGADVAVIDIESGALTTIPLTRGDGVSTGALRINRAGTRLYAALTTAAGGALLMIDARTGQVKSVAIGASIGEIAVDDMDRRIFVSGWDAESGGVLRIVDTATARIIHTIELDDQPGALLVTGGAVYLANGDDVVVIDASTAQAVNRRSIGRAVSCLAVSQDGSRLYVGDYDGSVTALSVQSRGLELRAAS